LADFASDLLFCLLLGMSIADFDPPLEILPSSDRNWLAVAVRLRAVYWEQAQEIIDETFEPGWQITGTAGDGKMDPLHMSLFFGTDVKWFDSIMQMAKEANIKAGDVSRVNFPYVFGHQDGTFYICQDLMCDKARRLKRAIESRFQWRNPTEIEGAREIPFHATFYTVKGTVKPGVRVRTAESERKATESELERKAAELARPPPCCTPGKTWSLQTHENQKFYQWAIVSIAVLCCMMLCIPFIGWVYDLLRP